MTVQPIGASLDPSARASLIDVKRVLARLRCCLLLLAGHGRRCGWSRCVLHRLLEAQPAFLGKSIHAVESGHRTRDNAAIERLVSDGQVAHPFRLAAGANHPAFRAQPAEKVWFEVRKMTKATWYAFTGTGHRQAQAVK